MIHLNQREVEVLGAIAWHYRQHAERCDNIANRPMAEKQKARDLERVAVLEKVLSQTTTEVKPIGGETMSEHLCNSCAHEVPTCICQNVIFGIDRDPSTAYTAEADRVLECDGYCNKKQYEDTQPPQRAVSLLLEQIREREDADPLQRSVSLLQALFDLQNGPTTERRIGAWVEVMGQSVTFLWDMEKAGVKAKKIEPIGGIDENTMA